MISPIVHNNMEESLGKVSSKFHAFGHLKYQHSIRFHVYSMRLIFKTEIYLINLHRKNTHYIPNLIFISIINFKKIISLNLHFNSFLYNLFKSSTCLCTVRHFFRSIGVRPGLLMVCTSEPRTSSGQFY